jgi:hypothetical protein
LQPPVAPAKDSAAAPQPVAEPVKEQAPPQPEPQPEPAPQSAEHVTPRTTVTYTQPGRRAQRPAGSQPQPGYSTVRTTRETMADHLLDALGRLWDKR